MYNNSLVAMCVGYRFLMLPPKRKIGNAYHDVVDSVSKSHAWNIYERGEGKRINGRKYAITAKINICMIPTWN